jgi:hypothetical protein
VVVKGEPRRSPTTPRSTWETTEDPVGRCSKLQNLKATLRVRTRRCVSGACASCRYPTPGGQAIYLLAVLRRG